MSKKNANKGEQKEKKHFLKDFKAELKRVIWPTPKQLVNNVIAVITIVIITAAIVFALDMVFETANSYGINKLKVLVENHKEESTVVDSDNKENNEESKNEQNEVVNNETTEEKTNNTENK